MAMALNSLYDLFVEQLKDLYDAEQQITQALPQMASAASEPKLKDAFQQHLDQTREQIGRLDQVFNEIGETPTGHTCEGMQGLIEEGREVLQMQGSSHVKDAALITAAQRVEHYEIAGYGSVRAYAKELGYDRAADLLQKTLDEEGETDKKLTKIAEGGMLSRGINEEARRQRR